MACWKGHNCPSFCKYHLLNDGGPLTPAASYGIDGGGPLTPAASYGIDGGGPLTPAASYGIDGGGPLMPAASYGIPCAVHTGFGNPMPSSNFIDHRSWKREEALAPTVTLPPRTCMRMKPSQQESLSQARRQKRWTSVRLAPEAEKVTGLYIPESALWKPVCSNLF